MQETDITKALSLCGIKKGDTILVHCDIGAFKTHTQTLKQILDSAFFEITEYLGNEGTLCVPAFFYEYARFGTPFDIKHSAPSRELGLFSAYVTQKATHRSPNPLSSIAALGEKAAFICSHQTGSAFGIDSVFDRLRQAQGKMVFIGIDLQAMTFIHYVEHLVGVPHIYNKYYVTPVLEGGVPLKLPISAAVRYLNFPVEIGKLDNTRKFTEAGLVKSAPIGSFLVRVVDCQEAFEFLRQNIQKDFFWSLKKKPGIHSGVPPIA